MQLRKWFARTTQSVILLVVLGMVTASDAASLSQGIPAPLPQPPGVELTGEFKFFLAGVKMPDRRVGFFKENGGEFEFWCGDCSFVVGEFGVAGATMDLGPGIVFRLNQDGSVLTATCKSTACTVVISAERTGPSRGAFSVDVKGLRNSETLDISTKARVLFNVSK